MLLELKEYATEVDVEFVRKAVRAIGRCAIGLERAAEACINVLLELIQTKVRLSSPSSHKVYSHLGSYVPGLLLDAFVADRLSFCRLGLFSVCSTISSEVLPSSASEHNAFWLCMHR